jgi:hypothetical protein
MLVTFDDGVDVDVAAYTDACIAAIVCTSTAMFYNTIINNIHRYGKEAGDWEC